MEKKLRFLCFLVFNISFFYDYDNFEFYVSFNII